MNMQELKDQQIIYNYLKMFTTSLPIKLDVEDIDVQRNEKGLIGTYMEENISHGKNSIKIEARVSKKKVIISVNQEHANYYDIRRTLFIREKYQIGGFIKENEDVAMYNEQTIVEFHRKSHKASKKNVNKSVVEKDYNFTDDNIDFLNNSHNLKEKTKNKQYVKRI